MTGTGPMVTLFSGADEVRPLKIAFVVPTDLYLVLHW